MNDIADDEPTLRDVGIAPDLLAEWQDYMTFALESEDLDDL